MTVLTPRRRTRVLWIAGIVMSAFVVGIPLFLRFVDPFDRSGWLPTGAALVEYGIGAVAGVAGVAVWMRSLHRFAALSASTGGPTRLPRAVRRAVHRREPVPPEYRGLVPDWLAVQRVLCVSAAAQVLAYPFAVAIEINADGRMILFAVALMTGVLLLPATAIGAYRLHLARLSRYWLSPPSSGHRSPTAPAR